MRPEQQAIHLPALTLAVDKLAGCAKIRQITNKGGVLVPLSEQQARGNIDVLLEAAGWHVCDASAANIHAARGVAIREFPLPGYGFADYLLYVDGKAAGVIEAKKEGVTLPMTSFHC